MTSPALMHASAEKIATETIHQRTDDDCLICCIAMATGRSYEDVMAVAMAADLYKPGKGTSATDLLISRLGFQHRQLNSQTDGDFSTRYLRSAETPQAFRMQTWGRRAILCVPSLNEETERGDGHAVYWDGAQLHDPSTRRRYEAWGDLEPGEITLFREAAIEARSALRASPAERPSKPRETQ